MGENKDKKREKGKSERSKPPGENEILMSQQGPKPE